MIVAKFKNRRDADEAAQLIRKYKSELKVMSAEEAEDFYLAQLIDEGMKEPGEVPLAEIQRRLRK
jgi:hypothetical protein